MYMCSLSLWVFFSLFTYSTLTTNWISWESTLACNRHSMHFSWHVLHYMQTLLLYMCYKTVSVERWQNRDLFQEVNWLFQTRTPQWCNWGTLAKKKEKKIYRSGNSLFLLHYTNIFITVCMYVCIHLFFFIYTLQ